jgi:methylglutaconyl-CoA hydratase
MADSASGAPVLYDVRKHAAWITLNTPHNHNALSLELCTALDDAVARALSDPGVRTLVLTGVGKTFCAGADLKSGGGGAARGGDAVRGGGAARGGGGSDARRSRFVSSIEKLWNAPKPVVGRFQGNAFGGGLGLMAACDIGIAVDGCRYAFTEVRLGLMPAIISVFVLRKMSLADATPYFLTGDRFTAAQAQAMRLVQRVVPEAELDAAVERVLDSLREGGPLALQECKQLLRRIPLLSVSDGLEFAEKRIGELFASAEGQEGMAAFAAKRKPNWVP